MKPGSYISRFPKHKTCFSFALGSLKTCPKAGQFWCGLVEYGQMGRKSVGLGHRYLGLLEQNCSYS